jgi:hypothetical protein
MMDMSLAPIIAQKRAENLGVAESVAVTFAAANEGGTQVAAAPDGCALTGLSNTAYEITCTEGEDTKFKQSVTRAFRLNDPSNSNNINNNSWVVDPPESFSIFNCPPEDPFGLENFNGRHGGWCVPTPLTHWGKQFPIEPEDWVYDLSPWFTGSATGPNG